MKFALTQIKSPQTHHNHHNSLSEVIETICHGLSELQYENIVTDDLSLSDYQYIVFAPYRNPTQPILPPNSIIYNFDQIYPNSPMVQAGYLDYLFQYPVWDYSLVNISQLKQWGINKVQYLPVGYVPQLTRIDLSAHKDIDVLFYGSINERREKILRALESRKVKVTTLFGVYGEERDSYIARAKIVLNIHFYESKIFEIVRISYLLANQVFVISEVGNSTEEEKYFSEGLIFVDYQNLVDTCIEYLEKDEQRKKIAQKGLELMQTRPITKYLKEVIPNIPLSNNKTRKFIKDLCRKRLAKIYLGKGKYADAIKLYEQSIEIDADCLESYWYLGLAFLYTKEVFTANLTWATGISHAEEIGKNSEEVINELVKILQNEENQQIKLNNHEYVNHIRDIINELES